MIQIYYKAELDKSMREYLNVAPFPPRWENYPRWENAIKPVFELPSGMNCVNFVRNAGLEDKVVLIDDWKFPPIMITKNLKYERKIN